MSQETGFEPEPELVRSFDGTFLAVRSLGESDATPVLLVNALGATFSLWRQALVDVVRERMVVTWDHRGLYDSGEPGSDRLDAGAHARDALETLDHYDIDRAVVLSWSSGTRIALELAAHHPDRVCGFVSVCGGYGQSAGKFPRGFELAALLPAAAGLVRPFAPLVQPLLRTLVQRPELAGLVRQSGLIAASADTGTLVDLVRSTAALDLGLLLAIYQAVSGDPAPGLLAEIAGPALVIAGERDPFTSRAVSEEMARTISGASLEVYEKATHYLPIEYPARLSDDLRSFLGPTLPPSG
ncbi:MAG: alpha/beta hydrolase [Actinobacteria bacterium]|nr:alpha/beta hydrolase [Actinomycetota bacterium]